MEMDNWWALVRSVRAFVAERDALKDKLLTRRPDRVQRNCLGALPAQRRRGTPGVTSEPDMCHTWPKRRD